MVKNSSGLSSLCTVRVALRIGANSPMISRYPACPSFRSDNLSKVRNTIIFCKIETDYTFQCNVIEGLGKKAAFDD